MAPQTATTCTLQATDLYRTTNGYCRVANIALPSAGCGTPVGIGRTHVTTSKSPSTRAAEFSLSLGCLMVAS